jgi:hypothetical protein
MNMTADKDGEKRHGDGCGRASDTGMDMDFGTETGTDTDTEIDMDTDIRYVVWTCIWTWATLTGNFNKKERRKHYDTKNFLENSFL